MLDYCFSELRLKCNSLQGKLDRKLLFLIRNSSWTKNANRNFVVNLSEKELDNDTICALGYGLSFAGLKQDVNTVDIAKSFCNLEKQGHLPSDEVNICKGIVYASVSNESVPNCPQRFVRAIKSIKKDPYLHITKADKSNAVVILNKDDYVSKTDDLFNDDTTYFKCRSNPLEKVNSCFNKKSNSY